jgi:hypothetical protein
MEELLEKVLKKSEKLEEYISKLYVIISGLKKENLKLKFPGIKPSQLVKAKCIGKRL